jgi:hypothetical protein
MLELLGLLDETDSGGSTDVQETIIKWLLPPAAR